MNKKIIIQSDAQVLFKGKMLNMPVKKDAIKEKSIELFDDEDPCIIHQSYVMKQFAETLETLFKDANQPVIYYNEHRDTLDFLDIDTSKPVEIRLKG